jgi:hypothetical protein
MLRCLLTAVHLAAEDEICGPAIWRAGPYGAARAAACSRSTSTSASSSARPACTSPGPRPGGSWPPLRMLRQAASPPVACFTGARARDLNQPATTQGAGAKPVPPSLPSCGPQPPARMSDPNYVKMGLTET